MALPPYNPNYTPSGVNNRENAYNRKVNHVRLAKDACNREEFEGGGGGDPVAPAFTVQPSISPATGPRGTLFTLDLGAWTGTAPVTPTWTLYHSVLEDVTDDVVGGQYDSDGVEPGTLTLTVYLNNAATGGSPVEASDTATLTATVAAAPVVTLDATSEEGFTLSWTYPDDGGAAITRTDIAYRIPPSGAATNVADVSSPNEITGRAPATTYQYRVRGLNAVGWGDWSAYTDVTTDEVVPPARATLALSDDLVWSTHSLLVTARGPDHGGDLYQYWTGAQPYVFIGFSSLKDRWDNGGIDVTFTSTDGMIVTEIADLGTGTYAPDSSQGIETLQYLYWFAKNAQDKGCQLFILYPPWSTAAMDTTYDDDTMAKWQYMTDWLAGQSDITMDVVLFPTPYIVRAFRDYYDPASIFGDGLHMTDTATDANMQSPYGMSRAVEMAITGVKSTRLTGGAHVTNLIDLAWDLLQGPSGYACIGLGGALTVSPYVPAGGDPLPSPLPLP